MIALHNTPIRLRLAGFDHLSLVIGVIELETVLKKVKKQGFSSVQVSDN